MKKTRLATIAWAVIQMPVVIFGIALIIRLWLAFRLIPNHAWDRFYQYNEFARIAWAVVSGQGYSSPWANTPLSPTAVEPPIYSYLLAAIFRIAGPYTSASLWIAICLNAVLAATTAVLILRIGKRDFSSSVGILAAWAWSCWIYEAAMALRLWESSLAAFWLTLALFVLPAIGASTQISPWILFGLLAGIAGSTNTTLLAVFPFFWLSIYIGGKRRGHDCTKQLLASVFVFLLVLVPWTIRNYAVFHRLMPVRDNFGLELWLGNHEAVSPRFDDDFPILNPSEYNRVGEIQFMDEKRTIALTFIGQHPVEFLWLSARRVFRYWTSPEVTLWLPISGLAWLGMVLGLRRKGAVATPYIIVLVAYPIVYYVTHTFNSYRHPTEPVMFILAAYAVTTVATIVRDKSLHRILS